VRVKRGSGLLTATSLRGLEPDMLGNIPAPVRSVRTTRTLERLAVQVADDVHVEPRSGGRPERAMWTLKHLQQGNSITGQNTFIIYDVVSKIFVFYEQ